MQKYILDYLLTALSSTELRLLLFVWRWTVCDGNKTIAITNDDIAYYCGISRSSVSKAAKRLINSGWIFADIIAGKPTTYSINFDITIPNIPEPTMEKIQ